MARTFNRRARLPPSTGNTGYRDGDPAHSHIANDLAYNLNNLTYVSPYAGFAHWPAPPGSEDGLPFDTFTELGVESSKNTFLAQVPTILPTDALRLNWTLDFYHGDPGFAPAVTIDFIRLWISSGPYNGPHEGTPGTLTWIENDQAFDETFLPTPVGSLVYDTPISCTAATHEHHHIEVTADNDDITQWMPFRAPTGPGSPLNNVWLILEVARHTSGAALTNELWSLAGFAWWVQYE